MPETTFLETVFRKRADRFRTCLLRASARTDEKEIHDLRVAIRRLLALFAVIQTLRGRKDYAAGTQKRLKSLMAPLGRLRDAQIKKLWLERVVPEGDDPSYRYALTVANDLEKWQNRARAVLRGADPSQFAAVLRHKDLVRLTPAELRALATSLLRTRRCDVLALREKAARESDATSLHRLRLAFKKYRYSAEIFAPLFPRVTDETLERLRAFQTRLGNLHDFDTILADAEHFIVSVLGRGGNPAVLSRFREMRRREFRKVQPILSRPDGLARDVFGDEFAPS